MPTPSTARTSDLEGTCHRLHRALLDADQQQAKELGALLDRSWALAANQRDRAVMRVMAHQLPHLALSASASDLPAETASEWHYHLMTLAGVTDLVLDLDVEGSVQEDLARLAQFEHAVAALSHLRQQRVVQLNSLARVLGVSEATCCNHLGRMLRMGMVDRISRGVYRLSARGEEVAGLLPGNGEQPERPERRRDMLADTDDQRPTAFGQAA